MSDSIDATNPYRARTPWGSPAPVGPTAAAPIGVFDSGVGGLTVARARGWCGRSRHPLGLPFRL